MSFTPTQIRNYLKNPYECPYCGSKSIEAHSLEDEGSSAYREVECSDCGKQWTELFEIASIEEVK